jgi:hypothetical protein
MGHVATPEPFPAGAGPVAHGDARALPHREQVWSHGTHGDTGALPCRVAFPMPRGTWWCQSSPAPGAGLEPRGHTATLEPFRAGCGVRPCGTRLKSCTRGYPIYRVPTNSIEKCVIIILT